MNKKIKDNYYKAYDKRYRQVYDKGYLWSTNKSTPEIIEIIRKENISFNAKILDIGCGEGRDAIFLLDNNYDVLAIDYSSTVIEKCRELSNYRYNDKFRQFDIVNDRLDNTFDFIYSVAVIHMFVNKEHRYKFYKFIYEHLNTNGSALIISMGDGVKEYKSDINKSFLDVERTICNNKKKINVAMTSCNIVNFDTLEKELLSNKLEIKRKWITNRVPEFSVAMCVLVSRNE
mgnify:CR=1 FL=1